MAKSYEKIYRALMDTEDAKKLEERVQKAYSEACVIRFEFTLTVHDGRPVAVPMFYTQGPFRPFQLNCAYCPVMGVIERADFRNIARDHFGVDVPTFFCRKNTVLDGCRSERGRVDTISFSDWAVAEVETKYQKLRSVAEQRLNEQSQALRDAPDYSGKEQEYLVRCCHDDVVRVMSSYSFLGDEVLRDALREFQVAEVMGS